MIGTPLNSRVRRVLGVTVGDDLALTLDAKATAYFPANVAVPSSDNSTYDGSPRSAATPWRLTWQTPPAELHACDRIEVPDDDTYELLSAPRPVTNGRRTVGYSAPMLPVSVLYPRSAELKALGEEAVIATVECSIYSERESKGGRGSYTDTLCELPPSAWSDIDGVSNLELHFADGSVWRITEATLAPEMPFVTASVRKAG